jgi:pantoate--beta-alanine ligase
MNIVTNLDEWKNIRKKLVGKSIGFVPTMGNIHAGHLSLCQRSCAENEITIVSIFVNPKQFNDQHDFENYPRTIEQDIRMLETQRIDYLLLPTSEEMYPFYDHYHVAENKISKELEGIFRPGHFDGMLTVVLKLLNLAQASRAYFGEKDYQQLILIKNMADAFFLPTEIIGCETVRDEEGVALSSRNSRLDREQIKKAAVFAELLKNAPGYEDITERLTEQGIAVDYITEQWQRRLGAVWIGGVRLIDNISLKKLKIVGD